MNTEYTHTTEHIDNYHVLVKIYKKGTKSMIHSFVVEDFGDWNEVDAAIKDAIERL